MTAARHKQAAVTSDCILRLSEQDRKGRARCEENMGPGTSWAQLVASFSVSTMYVQRLLLKIKSKAAVD